MSEFLHLNSFLTPKKKFLWKDSWNRLFEDWNLLSLLAEQTDSSWWLLDSGASTSVLAQSSVSAFNAAIAKENQGGFLAGNGSAVQMSGSTEIGVHRIHKGINMFGRKLD